VRSTGGPPGYPVSQRVRKRVEEIFRWVKTFGGGRKLHYIGLDRNHQWAVVTAAAYKPRPDRRFDRHHGLTIAPQVPGGPAAPGELP
jgi:hypothetical protein